MNKMKRLATKGSWLLVALILLASCSRSTYTYVSDIDTDYLRVNKYSAQEDDKIKEMIAPYKQQLDAEMNVVIGEIASEIVKSKPNGTLGNWFADLLQDIANIEYEGFVDFAVQNYGGLRVPSVAAGDLTVGDIYEIMPFDNKLVLLTLDGKTTQQLLDRIAAYGGWPVSSNLSMHIQDDKAIDIMIKDEPFDPNKSYRVALPDYTANGGDRCYFLKGIPQQDNGKLIRDLIIEYLKNNRSTEPMEAPTTKRIITQDYE